MLNWRNLMEMARHFHPATRTSKARALAFLYNQQNINTHG